MKILITGSSGYIGRVLSKHFTDNKVQTVGVDIHYDGYLESSEYFTFNRCSVTDKDEFLNCLEAEKPTHIIHLAYLMNPIHNKKKNYQIDVDGSKNVLQAANNTLSVHQIILLSSASAYGARPDNQLWIDEETPLRPGDYRYGIHKKYVEKYFQDYSIRNNLRLVILRMCTAIGSSYHKKGGVLSVIANAPLLPKFNNRYCELQFIHEDDLTALFSLIVYDSSIKGIYNLAPDSYATLKELAPDKRFLSLPLPLARGIMHILWWLRLSNSMPSAMTLSTYGIIINPEKLMTRYSYRFSYSTREAFEDTLRKRKEMGTL